MDHLGEPTGRRSEALRSRTVLYSCFGIVTLLLAGIIVPTSDMIASVAIAGTGLLLVGVQHFVTHRLVARSTRLIGKQEALLANFAASASANRSAFLHWSREPALSGARPS